jgi:hypothetical protein
MKTTPGLPQPYKPQVNVEIWARNSIRDLISGCVLNIQLKNAGICEKYICDMTNEEIERYYDLIVKLKRVMEKARN